MLSRFAGCVVSDVVEVSWDTDCVDDLSSAEAAALAGITPNAFRSMVGRGYAPQPDRRGSYHGHRWNRETIEQWLANRAGRGAGGGRPRALQPPPVPRAPIPDQPPPRVVPDLPDLGPCVEWQGRRSKDGYGEYGDNGRAHRKAWSDVYGPIPAGMVIRHRCDNPPCVRIDHLQIGTQADNVRDAVERGRARGGNARKSREEKLATRRAYYRKNYEKMREQERARKARSRPLDSDRLGD